MKVVILKGDSPRHSYFTQEILKLEGIEFMTLSPERLGRGRLKRMLLKSPKTFFNRISKYFFQKIRNWNKKEVDFFEASLPEQINVTSLNDKDTVKRIKEFDPDLIVAFGIPIISSKIIEIPKFGAINLHGGISPEYKGGNTIFWPLYKKDLTKVGATLHYMVKKVDSGRVITKVYPEIGETDSEFTISARTFKKATKEMVEIVKWIRKNGKAIYGEAQQGDGNLYLAKHRTFWVDLKGPSKIRKNLKGIHIEERIERFYE